MKILVKNIKQLVQVEEQPQLRVCGKSMVKLETIKDAFLFIDKGKIVEFGRMSDLFQSSIADHQSSIEEIDAKDCMVFSFLLRQPYPFGLCRKS